MSQSSARSELRQLCGPFGVELHRSLSNQIHFLVGDEAQINELAAALAARSYFLVAALANDERELEDRCFKIYYLFSHPSEDLFLILENALSPLLEAYPSLTGSFAAADPFEAEIIDLFGLYPVQDPGRTTSGAFLHAGYLPGFYPLRRDLGDRALQAAVEDLIQLDDRQHALERGADFGIERLAEGESYLPVGPIHAGVIEPGHFRFRIASEVIEEVTIRLGYSHKGIERLFQSDFNLAEGWKLAELVSGDSAFAHSLAYCLAAEALVGISAPAPAVLLRGVFLELERIANHIGDSAALAGDLALDVIAAEMGVLRETILRLNQHLSGNRFLRGLNRPGGLKIPGSFDADEARQTVTKVTGTYLSLAEALLERQDFRDRTIRTGVLTRQKALGLGITGLAARASGVCRDFRLLHPIPPYDQPAAQTLLQRTCKNEVGSGANGRVVDDLPETYNFRALGDVFSRFLVRAREVDASARLVQLFLDGWSETVPLLTQVDFTRAPSFEFGLGCVEGWRGDVIYWLFKDKFERIYRCKPRDPSTLNWPGLKAAVEPQMVEGQRLETALVDFPVINKSFNLSYSGNDL